MVTIVAVAMMAGGGTGALIAASRRSVDDLKKAQAESAKAIIGAQEALARAKAALARAQAKEAAEKAEAERRRKGD